MTYDQINIKIIRCVDYKSDAGWNHKLNLYPYNTLYFVMAGDGHISVGRETLELKHGHAYLIPANTLFSCWCDTHIHKLYVDVNVEAIPGYDIFSHLQKPREQPFPVEEIKRMIKASNHQSLKNLLYIKGQVSKAISLFMEDDFRIEDNGILKFRSILNDIEENLSCELKVAQIAEKYCWNAAMLSKNFKKVFHCSLKCYIEKLLLNKIKQELIISDKSIKQLASEYKFCDQYYLTRFFKKHEKISPSQYRRKVNRTN